MRIIIINRTDKTQKIRKSNGDIVAINAYSPYILETNFNPEINFWKNCTDTRFIVSDRIQDLNKLVASLPKTVANKQKQIISDFKSNTTTNTTTTETNSKIIDKPVIEPVSNINDSNINKEPISVSVNNSNNIEIEPDTINVLDKAYVKADEDFNIALGELSVKDLKILSEKYNIELPKQCKKAVMIEIIQKALNK